MHTVTDTPDFFKINKELGVTVYLNMAKLRSYLEEDPTLRYLYFAPNTDFQTDMLALDISLLRNYDIYGFNIYHIYHTRDGSHGIRVNGNRAQFGGFTNLIGPNVGTSESVTPTKFTEVIPVLDSAKPSGGLVSSYMNLNSLYISRNAYPRIKRS